MDVYREIPAHKYKITGTGKLNHQKSVLIYISNFLIKGETNVIHFTVNSDIYACIYYCESLTSAQIVSFN